MRMCVARWLAPRREPNRGIGCAGLGGGRSGGESEVRAALPTGLGGHRRTRVEELQGICPASSNLTGTATRLAVAHSRLCRWRPPRAGWAGLGRGAGLACPRSNGPQ